MPPCVSDPRGSTRLRDRLPLHGLRGRVERSPPRRQGEASCCSPAGQHRAAAWHQGHLREPRLPVQRVRRGAAASQRATTVESKDSIVIPRHELPGRIVLSIGLFLSWWCVIGLIVLELGG
jgi:hypothetical protein